MRAGTLRDQIKIVHILRTDDELGGATHDWSEFATLWARKLSRREAERSTGMQLEGIERRVYEIRYIDGITTAMAIVAEDLDRPYRLTAVEDPDEGRRRRLLLTCERPSAGVV
jgi:SPP1 family predicted phage head-tail adaptor